jgi:hypothetical protein
MLSLSITFNSAIGVYTPALFAPRMAACESPDDWRWPCSGYVYDKGNAPDDGAQHSARLSSDVSSVLNRAL